MVPFSSDRTRIEKNESIYPSLGTSTCGDYDGRRLRPKARTSRKRADSVGMSNAEVDSSRTKKAESRRRAGPQPAAVALHLTILRLPRREYSQDHAVADEPEPRVCATFSTRSSWR